MMNEGGVTGVAVALVVSRVRLKVELPYRPSAVSVITYLGITIHVFPASFSFPAFSSRF